MTDRLFETEVIYDVTEEEPERLCRMTFTADELHAVARVLNAGALSLNHRDASTIALHFYEAWQTTAIRASDGED